MNKFDLENEDDEPLSPNTIPKDLYASLCFTDESAASTVSTDHWVYDREAQRRIDALPGGLSRLKGSQLERLTEAVRYALRADAWGQDYDPDSVVEAFLRAWCGPAPWTLGCADCEEGTHPPGPRDCGALDPLGRHAV